ncbi:hypothetical protein QBK99_05290 [Corticibacterium sp. UT-5YL-CI-8]|nr:hypothetical protein [Tianweitania sp. UT-5YL-CI-8]
MAKTLVGRLQLIVQAMGLENASKVEGSISAIEKAAKRLADSKWGQNFQRQIDKLGLGAKEIEAVRRSWTSLEKDMSARGLTKALQKSEISAWRTSTIGHFAAVKLEAKNANDELNRTLGVMKRLGRAGLVAGGAFSITYGVGMAGRAALKAASEGQRTKYRYEMAGINKADTKTLDDESARLAGKYGVISKNDILELGKTAYALFGGKTDLAKQVLEELVKSFVADFVSSGEEYAGQNLTSFLKAMDNLNVNEGGEGGIPSIGAILEGWVKAKQVEGRDIDIAEILDFAKRAKVSKYALSDEFLSTVLPAAGQDTGFGPLGDALSGAYQNFVTPSSGGSQGQYVKRQQAAGLRDGNNSLVERDLFASNPYKWTIDVLKPLLQKNGVDTESPAATAEAVKKLMSNSKAAALITGWIAAQDQIDKNIENYQRAGGMEDAENARGRDPFAAWRDMKSSLEDLSNAAGETVLPVIVPALNTFADTIRAFSEAVRAGDPAVLGGVGIATAGVAAWGGFKVASAVWGLITAGTNLNIAAAALQAAAVAQGGGAALPDGTAGGGKGKGGGALLGAFSWLASLLLLSGDTPKDRKFSQADQDRWLDEWAAVKGYDRPQSGPLHRGRRDSGEIARENSLNEYLDGVVKDSQKAGDEAKSALSFNAAPTVDMSALLALEALIGRVISGFRQIGVEGSAVSSNLDAQLRRSHADFGVVP